MAKRLTVALLVIALAVSSWALAGPAPQVPSQLVEKQIKKLTTKVHWYSSLEEAREKAKKANKLVFWLHALGDLDGTT